jgi:MFS family permease
MPLRMAESRSPLFYGWYVLAATSLILFISSGARLTIGVMMKPVIAEFGWSRSAVSLAVFSNMVVFAISVIIVGKVYDRYGPKWVILVSSLLFSAGYMLMAVMSSFWQFFFLYGVLAAAGTGGTTLSIFAAVMSKWFEKRRGLAISLGLSGGCIGQFAIVPLFTHMVLAYGWRLSNLFIGLVSLVVNVILVLLVIKGDPDDLGVEPYGRATANHRESAGHHAPEASGVRDLGLGEAMNALIVALLSSCLSVAARIS